jgi:hypothetical protein
MKLSRKERELLGTIVSILQKVMVSRTAPTSRRGERSRQRRSRAEAAELKKQVRAARRRNMSAKEIATELGLTPTYVYQLLR